MCCEIVELAGTCQAQLPHFTDEETDNQISGHLQHSHSTWV